MTAPAVEGRDVVLAYGETVAVRRSDFHIPEGRLTALIGPNGSGKSTLLSGIAGLAQLRSGWMRVLGAPAGVERRRIAYVLQTTKVNDAMPVTVRELVCMGRYADLGMLGRFTRADREAVDAAIDRMDIGNLVNRHISELSGGQKQRVFVAQGLAQDNDLLLLDEPFTGLDLVSAETIDAVIREHQRSGRTVVVTTHALADARAADHVLLMGGSVVASGPPEEVLVPALLMEAYGPQVHHDDGHDLFVDDPAHESTDEHHVHLDRASGTHTHDTH